MRSEPRIVAEGVSKQYPGRRQIIFPPVLSIFERDLSLFRERRRSNEQGAPNRAYAGEDAGFGDEDEDDEEDDERDRELEDDVLPARARPDEMFWALRDISLRVAPGAALGVVGGPGAGKSTLLRILAGRALPTEGRVCVRGSVAPLPAELHKALAVSGKRGDDLVLASRLLGLDPQLVKQHRDEIEELAQPLTTPDGDPARGARIRLGIATSVVVPASVVLLEEPRGLDETFIRQVFERLRERMSSGTSLVLASRRREFVQELCDEVIVLDEGSIVDGAAPTQAAAAFNEWATLLSAEVQTVAGKRSKRLNGDEPLMVEIRLETAVPQAEVRCGVCFTPRGGGTDLRVDLPEPVRLADPGTYVLVARIPPGTLRGGGYAARADAVVARGAAPASAIACDVGRFRIEGDRRPAKEPGDRVEAEWSIE